MAQGRLRLGRPGDSPYPAPIRSQGQPVQKVQLALTQLGYPLPRSGADGRYGAETYSAVLAYKRRYNIRTYTGYLDGIVGPKTIAHLDAALPTRPLPPLSAPGPAAGRGADSRHYLQCSSGTHVHRGRRARDLREVGGSNHHTYRPEPPDARLRRVAQTRHYRYSRPAPD